MNIPPEMEGGFPLPRTQAGRDLLAELSENPLPGARYARSVVARQLAAVEAEAAEQHEAALRARGWQDEYEAATAAAMNFGDGYAEALPSVERLARALCVLNQTDEPDGDDYESAAVIRAALRDEPEDKRP